MTKGYIVREAFQDTRKHGDRGDNPLLAGKGALFNANFYVIVDIVDDAALTTVLATFTTWANDLADPRIEEAARAWIADLEKGQQALAAVTKSVFKVPAPVDPDVLDAQQKAAAFETALMKLSRLKQQVALGVAVLDSEITTATDETNTARAELAVAEAKL